VKHAALLSLLLLIHTVSNAEPQIITVDAVCDDTDYVFSVLNKMNEIPIAIAIAEDVAESKVLLWVSPAKETWTLTATKDKTTCVIGFGSNFKLIIPRKKNST
jgi:hypothetical protein